MKTKYKYYILLWSLLISAIFGTVTTYFIINNTDKTYVIGGTAFVIYFLLVAGGNKFIANRAKKDPVT